MRSHGPKPQPHCPQSREEPPPPSPPLSPGLSAAASPAGSTWRSDAAPVGSAWSSAAPSPAWGDSSRRRQLGEIHRAIAVANSGRSAAPRHRRRQLGEIRRAIAVVAAASAWRSAAPLPLGSPSPSPARGIRRRQQHVEIRRVVAAWLAVDAGSAWSSASPPAWLADLRLKSSAPSPSSARQLVKILRLARAVVRRYLPTCLAEVLFQASSGSAVGASAQKKPGLSAYANDPQKAAESLVSLLEEAEKVVPMELREQTPVRVGATAGLRALGTERSEEILQAVRDLLRDKSSFKSQPDWVTVLDGSQEGAFQWVTINYLLGKLGKPYSHTVGVVDLGGGSVQMAYAISEKDAAKAPQVSDGEGSYVKKLLLKGTTYYLYVHSYLHYGLLAARAEILKAGEGNDYSNCMLEGHHGKYKYGDDTFEASGLSSGASYSKCRAVAVRALKVDEPACTHMKCTFGGVWNGGGGDGQKNLFVASFFFDRAAEAGFVNPKESVAKVKPSDFEEAARRVCKLNVKDAQATYPDVSEENIPYLCMDLIYQYTLLVDGFGVDPYQDIMLVKKVPYSNSFVEAAWPLGSAIEVASSP